MAVLRIYIDEGWPEGGGVCDWAVVDAGRVVGRGRSSAELWPGTDGGGDPLDAIELALDPTLYSLHETQLPQGVRHGFAHLAGAALEDRLLDAPERYHFVRLSPEKTNPVTILAIPSPRLAEIIASLRRRESLPRITRAVAVSSLLPAARDVWWIWPAPGGRLLVHGGIGAAGALGTMALDRASDLNSVFATASGSPSGRVCLLGTPKEPIGLPVPVEPMPTLDWAAEDWYAAPNLLTGAFRPGGTGNLARGLRRAALAAILLLIAFTIGLTAEWRFLAAREAALRADLRQLAERALPGQPLVSPLTQLATEADRAAHRRGEAGQGDLLAMTNLVAEFVAPSGVRELSYSPGRIEFRLDRFDQGRERAMGDALSRTGFDAMITRGGNETVLVVSWLPAGASP